MPKKYDPIESAEQLLTEIRTQVDDCADYSACRNIVELSRQHIVNLLSTQGYSRTVETHRGFIQQALFLSDLLKPDSSQILPGKNDYNIDLWRFIESEYEPIMLDEETINKVGRNIDFALNSVFRYLDESYSNLDTIFDHTNCPESRELFFVDEERFYQIDQSRSLPELAENLAPVLNVHTANRMFSQLFELNRILFRYNLNQSNLTHYVHQQDVLFNAYTGFKLCEDFSFFNSPLGPITTVNKQIINLAIHYPEQSGNIVKKTSELVGLEWLYNSLDILSDNFTESTVRSILDISGVYNDMNFESRHRFDMNFEHRQLQSFIKSAVEIGANGDAKQATLVLESLYTKKYENLIVNAAFDIDYDSNSLIHQLVSDLEYLQHTRRILLSEIKSKYSGLTKPQKFIYKQVFKLALNSKKFREVVLDVFPFNIAIH